MSRLPGLALFLPVPVVLWLFTSLPLGSLPSLGIGVLLMGTHALYARPFALHHADRRCLWCCGPAERTPSRPGRTAESEPAAAAAFVLVREPRGTTSWRACTPAHHARLVRTLAWAGRRRLLLRAGILGSLLVFFAGTVWTSLRTAPWTTADAAAVFRLAIALLVLPLGWRGPSADPADPGASPVIPFPVHIQALIGTWAVLWLFRVIGLIWLIQGIRHFVTR